MSHAVHFLKRLERASTEQCELALRLYRDQAALTYLLQQTGLGLGRTKEEPAPSDAGRLSGKAVAADRVAFSLDRADRGPYLVVSRSGEFITCLGAEMSLNDLQLLPHAQLLRLLGLLERQREREAAAQERPQLQDLTTLRTQLLRRAHRLPREELLVLETLQPVLRFPGLNLMEHFFHDLRDARPHLMKLLAASETRPLRQHEEEQLRIYHQKGWVSAHLLALAALNGPVGLEQVLAEFRPTFTWKVFRHGVLGWGAFALWAAGKIGKPLVASYKAVLTEDPSPVGFLDAFCSLLMIALRHRKLRHEITKVIRALGPRPMQGAFFVTQADEAHSILEQLLTDDEALAGMVLPTLQNLVAGLLQGTPAEARYTGPQEIPAAITVAATLHLPASYLLTPSGACLLLRLLPWLARLELSDLFLPEALVEMLVPAWQPEDSLWLLDIYRLHYRNENDPLIRQPVQLGPQPGRNDPCPCGSGKKYKKCCLGRAEGALKC